MVALIISKRCFLDPSQIIARPCHFLLGTDGATKTHEFSEQFQMAFDPLPHFRNITLQFFSFSCSKSPVLRSKIGNINFYIENESPLPLGPIRKFICFGDVTRPSARGGGTRRYENHAFANKNLHTSGFPFAKYA